MFRYGATAMQPNTWYHIAGVYNATTRTMDVYLNGQLDNGELVGTVTASQQNSPQNVYIGQRASGGIRLQRPHRRCAHLRPSADGRPGPSRHEHPARIGGHRPTRPADGVHHPPGERRAGQRHRHDHRQRRRQHRRRRRPVLRRRCGYRCRGHDAPVRSRNGTRATASQRLAHAHGAGARTRRATPTTSAAVAVNVANANRLPERGARDRLRPADEHRVPARRSPARRRAGGQDPRPAAAVHPAGPDAVPAAHERRLCGRAAGHLRHRPRPGLRDQPLLLRLLHARARRTGIGSRGSPPTPTNTGTVAGSELVLYQDPAGRATPSTTAAPSRSATTASCTSPPASTSTPATRSS